MYIDSVRWNAFPCIFSSAVTYVCGISSIKMVCKGDRLRIILLNTEKLLCELLWNSEIIMPHYALFWTLFRFLRKNEMIF